MFGPHGDAGVVDFCMAKQGASRGEYAGSACGVNERGWPLRRKGIRNARGHAAATVPGWACQPCRRRHMLTTNTPASSKQISNRAGRQRPRGFDGGAAHKEVV